MCTIFFFFFALSPGFREYFELMLWAGAVLGEDVVWAPRSLCPHEAHSATKETCGSRVKRDRCIGAHGDKSCDVLRMEHAFHKRVDNQQRKEGRGRDSRETCLDTLRLRPREEGPSCSQSRAGEGQQASLGIASRGQKELGQDTWEPLRLHMQPPTTVQKIAGTFWKMICTHTCGNMYVPTYIDTSHIKVTCVHIHKMRST